LYTPLIPAFRRKRLADLYKSEANLVYKTKQAPAHPELHSEILPQTTDRFEKREREKKRKREREKERKREREKEREKEKGREEGREGGGGRGREGPRHSIETFQSNGQNKKNSIQLLEQFSLVWIWS
jgi:hypothetical protein